jgi:hypothetical protein
MRGSWYSQRKGVHCLIGKAFIHNDDPVNKPVIGRSQEQKTVKTIALRTLG